MTDAPAGASFKVVRVTLGREVGKRLADMGFTEGAEGAVVRRGFFDGPFHVRIRGYDVMIRGSEAAGIEVEPIGDWSAIRDSRRGFGWGFGHGRRGGHGPRCAESPTGEGGQRLGEGEAPRRGKGRRRACGCDD